MFLIGISVNFLLYWERSQYNSNYTCFLLLSQPLCETLFSKGVINPMMTTTLSYIPWEDRPTDCVDIVWRYSANPIIPRDLIPSSNSIFNSAVVPFRGKFAGVFRCDNKKREMNIHRGFSDNGIDWQIDDDPIDWEFSDPELSHFQYRYDPRVVWVEDRYYIVWCNGYHGPTIGIGQTFDFEKFTFLENALPAIQPQWRSFSSQDQWKLFDA